MDVYFSPSCTPRPSLLPVVFCMVTGFPAEMWELGELVQGAGPGFKVSVGRVELVWVWRSPKPAFESLHCYSRETTMVMHWPVLTGPWATRRPWEEAWDHQLPVPAHGAPCGLVTASVCGPFCSELWSGYRFQTPAFCYKIAVAFFHYLI